MTIDEAISQSIRDTLPQYDEEMAKTSPANPDYFGEEDIKRVIARFHVLLDFVSDG